MSKNIDFKIYFSDCKLKVWVKDIRCFLKQNTKPLDFVYQVLIKEQKFIQVNLFELTSKKKLSTSGLEIKMATVFFFG